MRYLVLTDIHANLEALETCLRDAGMRGYDRTLVLGDLVGYGPDPNEVTARIQSLQPVAIVRGNHDKVAAGLETAEGFNPVARTAAAWTHEALTPPNRSWLAALPRGPRAVDDLIEICHGSPGDEDEYVFDDVDALRAIEAATRPLCLFGHTHYPAVFALSGKALEAAAPASGDGTVLALAPGTRYLVNPGAVGQPRDGDPRAAYALVDAKARTIDLVRVEYPVAATQAKIVAAGLPEMLARRLAAGR
jgi:diadenosine tetraphosphatase ApaH/serine/threonine PP2A family protein phosphatase